MREFANRRNGGGALAACLAFAWGSASFVGGGGCGYRALDARTSGGESAPSLHVKVVRALLPDAVTCDAIAVGASEELARAGLLGDGDGFPRMEIEVLRADETSEGIAAVAAQPVARATDVAVVARAWIVDARGATPQHDTGDLRTVDVIAVDETADGLRDPRASAFHEADAARAAARRLGRRLARRVTGLPAASDDLDERP